MTALFAVHTRGMPARRHAGRAADPTLAPVRPIGAGGAPAAGRTGTAGRGPTSTARAVAATAAAGLPAPRAGPRRWRAYRRLEPDRAGGGHTGAASRTG